MSKCYDFSANPSSVWLTVTRRCNFRCKWCYAKGSHYNPADDMSFDQAKKLVELVRSLGINHVTLTGGEPTLWPHLFAFNDYARGRGVSVSMTTNACKFGDDKYRERYLKSPCDNVGVSIKGITKRQFVDIVGVPALFANTIKGIGRAIEHYPELDIGTVYSTLTSKDDIRTISQSVRDLGAKSFVVSPCGVTVSDGVPSDQYVVEPKQLVEDIQELYGFLDELFDGKIVIEMSLPYCMWPQEFLDRLVEEATAWRV
jgi:MoaA/NifB/PqqE/SkfB family radical SAM enzyme